MDDVNVLLINYKMQFPNETIGEVTEGEMGQDPS